MHVPLEAITLPDKEIKGPNLDLESKEFITRIKVRRLKMYTNSTLQTKLPKSCPELRATIRTQKDGKTEHGEPDVQLSGDSVRIQGPESVEEREPRKPINHDEPMDSDSLEEVDSDLLHGSRGEGEDQRLPGLAWGQSLAGLARGHHRHDVPF